MSLDEIRNPWVRRPLTVISAIVLAPAIVLVAVLGAMFEYIPDFCSAVRDAWRGPVE